VKFAAKLRDDAEEVQHRRSLEDVGLAQKRISGARVRFGADEVALHERDARRRSVQARAQQRRESFAALDVQLTARAAFVRVAHGEPLAHRRDAQLGADGGKVVVP